jgi:hypothetical protein
MLILNAFLCAKVKSKNQFYKWTKFKLHFFIIIWSINVNTQINNLNEDVNEIFIYLNYFICLIMIPQKYLISFHSILNEHKDDK